MLKLKKISLRGGVYILFLLITGLLNASSVSPDVMEDVAGTQLPLEMDNESITTQDTSVSSPLTSATSDPQEPGALSTDASLPLSQESTAPKDKKEKSDDGIDLEDVALYGGIAAGAVVGTAAVGSAAGSAVTTYLARPRGKQVLGTQQLIEDMKAGLVGADEIGNRVDEAARVDKLTLQDVYKQLDAEYARIVFSPLSPLPQERQANDFFQAALIEGEQSRGPLSNSQKEALNPLIDEVVKVGPQKNVFEGFKEAVVRSNLPFHQAQEELAARLSEKLPDIEKQLVTNETTEKNIRIQYEAANQKLKEAKTPQEKEAAQNIINEANKGLNEFVNKREDLKRNQQQIKAFIADSKARGLALDNARKKLSENILKMRTLEQARSVIQKMQASKDFKPSDFQDQIKILKAQGIDDNQLKKIFEDAQRKIALQKESLETVVKNKEKDIQEQQKFLEKLKKNVQTVNLASGYKDNKLEINFSYFNFETMKEEKKTKVFTVSEDKWEEKTEDFRRQIKEERQEQAKELEKEFEKNKEDLNTWKERVKDLNIQLENGEKIRKQEPIFAKSSATSAGSVRTNQPGRNTPTTPPIFADPNKQSTYPLSPNNSGNPKGAPAPQENTMRVNTADDDRPPATNVKPFVPEKKPSLFDRLFSKPTAQKPTEKK